MQRFWRSTSMKTTEVLWYILESDSNANGTESDKKQLVGSAEPTFYWRTERIVPVSICWHASRIQINSTWDGAHNLVGTSRWVNFTRTKWACRQRSSNRICRVRACQEHLWPKGPGQRSILGVTKKDGTKEREGGGADKGAHPTPPCAPGLTCCLLMALFSVNMPPLGRHVGVNTNYGKLLGQPGTLYCHILGLLFTQRCCLSALFLRSLRNQPKNCTTIGPTAPRGHGTHLSWRSGVMLLVSVCWDQSLTFKVMLVGDKSGGLKPQDDHSKTESGNRESQRQVHDNVFFPNILKSDQICRSVYLHHLV